MPSFPTFTAGTQAFRPYTVRHEFKADHLDNEVGFRFSYSRRATPIRQWAVTGAVISDADLTTLREFWDDMSGAYGEFEFTDPDTSTTYTRCRFVGNELAVRHIGVDENSVSFTVKQLV